MSSKQYIITYRDGFNRLHEMRPLKPLSEEAVAKKGRELISQGAISVEIFTVDGKYVLAYDRSRSGQCIPRRTYGKEGSDGESIGSGDSSTP